jgi:hypothetical protein
MANPIGLYCNRVDNKAILPVIKGGLTTKIKLIPNFTAIVRTHDKTKAYLHRFKIIKSPECPCDGGNQTADHLIYDCTKLQWEGEKLKSKVSKQDNWPVDKCDFVNRQIKHFSQFVNSIDFENYDHINCPNERKQHFNINTSAYKNT